MNKKIEKLSDKIEWEDDATALLETLMVRLRKEIADEAIKVTWRNDRPKIDKGTILSVLHGTKPITYFVQPED